MNEYSFTAQSQDYKLAEFIASAKLLKKLRITNNDIQQSKIHSKSTWKRRRQCHDTDQDTDKPREPEQPATPVEAQPERDNVLAIGSPSSVPPKDKKVSSEGTITPVMTVTVHVDSISNSKKRCSLGVLVEVELEESGVKTKEDQEVEVAKSKKLSPLLYTLCTTSMHREDQMLVASAVRNLDQSQRFVLGSEITKDTTHVLVGTPRRTINLLKAIIWGCWIVNLDWVTQSISSSKWLPEADFVLKEDFPVLKLTRDEMRSTAAELFTTVGPVFVERDTKPPRDDLVELITACGGQISLTKSGSDVCVGGEAPDKSHANVTELWILDSISSLKLQKMVEYSIFPYRSPSPDF